MKNIPTDYIIETDRFFLRIPNESDIPRTFSATRYEGFNDGMLWDPPKSIDELIEPLQKSIIAWEEGGGYSFVIESKNKPGLCGKISIRKTAEKGVWNVGFWTHPNQQKKGIMTEALAGMLSFGFKEIGATKIEACYAVWNNASRRVLEKNGFVYERHIPKGFKKNGKWVPEDLMVISLEQWESRHK